jgi:hypothetical protein
MIYSRVAYPISYLDFAWKHIQQDQKVFSQWDSKLLASVTAETVRKVLDSKVRRVAACQEQGLKQFL